MPSTISYDQVYKYFKNDLANAESRLKREIGEKTFNGLDQRRKEMLLDFTFNLGGVSGFPKFKQAVLNNDIETMRKEYKRYYFTPSG